MCRWLGAAVLAVALGLMALAGPAAAEVKPKQCGKVAVEPAELTINGLLGDADSFAATLRVTASKQDVKPFFLAAGELKTGEPGGPSIAESKIDVPPLSEALPVNEPRPIRVTVKDVRFAGTYHGALKLAGGRCRVGLTVVAAGATELGLVGPAGTTAKLKLVRCQYHTCGPWRAMRSLVPGVNRRNRVVVQLDNASQSPALVTDVQVALHSDPGQRLVPNNAFVAQDKSFTLSSKAVSRKLRISINRGELKPGHYIGAIYLTVANTEKRMVLPFEVDVKDGPFWAVVVLLAALFVQFLVWLASRNLPRKEELRELRELRKQVEALPRSDQGLLEERLDVARDNALGGKLEKAKAEREAIKVDIARLESARELEAEAVRKAGHLPHGIKAILRELRAAVKKGDSAAANSKLTDLREEVGKLPEPPRVEALEDRPRPRLAPRRRAARRAARPAGGGGMLGGVAAVVLIGAATWLVTGTLLGAVLGVVVATLALIVGVSSGLGGLAGAGWRSLRHGVVYFSIYWLPWILRGLLVALFVLAGLKELYYNDTTFGEQVVLDYGALFLWGLSATAVNKALGKVIPGQE